MPRAARRRPGVRNGYCIYYISAVAVRGASPCRTSTKSGTPGRTTRADDNNGDTVAAGSANNDGIRAGWSSCGPAPCPGASGQPGSLPGAPPWRKRRLPGAGAGGPVRSRRQDGAGAQKRQGRCPGTRRACCAGNMTGTLRKRPRPSRRLPCRSLQDGAAARGAAKDFWAPSARIPQSGTRTGYPGARPGMQHPRGGRGGHGLRPARQPPPGAAAVVCPGMAAGRGAPAQALNGGSGARPDGHHPHGPRPEDVLTAERVPRQRGRAADRAQTVFTSP